MRNAVQTGAMPMINTMNVIGIISIPGMMTGQILGGSPVMEAARYQILIIYLIAVCSFGAILANMGIALWFGFDASHMLISDRFTKRPKQLSFLDRISKFFQWLCCCCCGFQTLQSSNISEMQPLTNGSNKDDEDGAVYTQPNRGSIEVKTMMRSSSNGNSNLPLHRLEIRGITRSFSTTTAISSTGPRVVLFQDLSYSMESGEIAVVRGASGAGKSQFLRVVAGLSPMEKGGAIDLIAGQTSRDITRASSMPSWRREVRYVTQYKVDIPGTPMDFIRRITSLQSWRTAISHRAAEHYAAPPTLNEMTSTTLELVQQFGLEASKLDCEWNVLSGGEAQRVMVAVALASRPRVLLFDESTSALDLDTKICVEQTVQGLASKWDMIILWITHDQDQINRLGARSGCCR
jgi:ABC-type iron transport system FetAB ATPase subunit